MLSVSSELEEHLEGEVLTLARLFRIERTDGQMLFFTDAVRPVVWDGDEYRSDISFTCSAILSSSTARGAQSVTLEIILDDEGLKETDLRARLYDDAKGDIFIVNYEDPDAGVIHKFAGTFGQVVISDKRRCTIELRSPDGTGKGQIAGEVYSQTCRASLGDARCGVDIESSAIEIEVSAVSGNVIVAPELVEADNFYKNGTLFWTSGDNIGATFVIVSSNLATQSVTLAQRPLRNVQVGDTATVFQGCDKTILTCRDKYNNVRNFRGEPYVPSLTTVETEEITLAGSFPTASGGA